jgi:hypothetical protein
MLMMLVPLDPSATDRLGGDAERVKSGAATPLTLSITVVV